MDRRTLLALLGSSFTGGCASVLPDEQSPSVANQGSSPATADCSDATITTVSVTASTSGDTITVEGEVSSTPAPALRGFVIENSCPDSRHEITIELNATGTFERSFSYSHHGIRDYQFWLEGCSPKPTPESTITCSTGQVYWTEREETAAGTPSD